MAPSPKNKTLQLSSEERILLETKLLRLKDPVSSEEIVNRTIQGDLLEVLDFLPKQFADLIIIDPPYNLSKNFSGLKFKQLDDAGYLNYLESWFPKVVECLKPNG